MEVVLGSQTIVKETTAGRVCIEKIGFRYRLKRFRFAVNKGKLLLLCKTRLEGALRVNAIHDCLDDV